ncbi:hypothetical protein COV23_01200 [Candidatus Wolfebacteria bacterium CG10_big_fil_rev_8_21_14_0_10_31_9]|uniref:DUF4145 domain-containing protein n=1 Tax=Candidatus Wolfebacteria bacterium CG10_big_fil_rev_8_21_14_0_10_31_9 TaxID=1975070 RepID=A0A2H0RED7_9BACT|nr:MAG: hypothetical protein COV23_01200 [Candidatus Wolfebacteria bacterium CG10_big_fil_rev_8_21_14_0_10_31_9]
MELISSIVSILNIVVAIVIGLLISVFIILFFQNRRFSHKIATKEAMIIMVKQSSKNITESDYTKRMSFRNDIREKWMEIVEAAKHYNQKELHLAIIKADSLVDNILKQEGCPGDDMGERLRTFNKDSFKCLDKLWEAHKIRNKLAHEPDFKISESEARKILDLYYDSLEELLSREMELV